MRQLKITQKITSRETISLNKYLQDISSIPLLTVEEEQTLSERVKAGDEAALNKFVEANLRFVISVAKQYQGNGEILDDLVSAGNEGLIAAVKRFDASRGFKFISYAVWWIRQSITKHIGENGKSIRLPFNKIQMLNKIRNTTTYLEQKLQRSPTADEISEELFLRAEISGELNGNFDIATNSTKTKKNPKKNSAQEVQGLISANQHVSSLDFKLSDDGDSTLLDLFICEGMEDVDQKMKNDDLQRILKTTLENRLTFREKEILTLNFGLFGEIPTSLDEIAEKLDLTKERIRQIKEKAIRRLRFGNTKQMLQLI